LGKDGGRQRQGKEVDEKGQKEYLEGRTVDCSTGEGGKVKRMKTGIR
jgi:hypothetical protein